MSHFRDEARDTMKRNFTAASKGIELSCNLGSIRVAAHFRGLIIKSPRYISRRLRHHHRENDEVIFVVVQSNLESTRCANNYSALSHVGGLKEAFSPKPQQLSNSCQPQHTLPPFHVACVSSAGTEPQHPNPSEILRASTRRTPSKFTT